MSIQEKLRFFYCCVFKGSESGGWRLCRSGGWRAGAGLGPGRNLGAAEPFPAAAGTALRQDAAAGGAAGRGQGQRGPLPERGHGFAAPAQVNKSSLRAAGGAGPQGAERLPGPSGAGGRAGLPAALAALPARACGAVCEGPGAAAFALIAQTRLQSCAGLEGLVPSA